MADTVSSCDLTYLFIRINNINLQASRKHTEIIKSIIHSVNCDWLQPILQILSSLEFT